MHTKLRDALAAMIALSHLKIPNSPSVEDVDQITREVAKAGRAFGDLLTAIAEMADGREIAKYTNADLVEELVGEALFTARRRAQDREEDAEYTDPNAEHRLTACELGVGRYA